MIIEFTVDCPVCGEVASAGNTLFTDYEEGKPLRVDLELAAAQMKFFCENEDCGAECYSGDYEVFSDNDE
jgi:hypothetical protein